MKKIGDRFLLGASLALSAVTVVCAVNILIGLIKSASPNTPESYYFFMKIANIYLSVAIGFNGILSVLFSSVLLYRKRYKIVTIISIFLCIFSFICVLAFFLI